MGTDCAPAGVGAYRCMFPIPYLVGDAIALPNVEFRHSAGLLVTANTSIFHPSLMVFVLITLGLHFRYHLHTDSLHRFDLPLGPNIRYKPRLKSFLFALDAAKSLRRASLECIS